MYEQPMLPGIICPRCEGAGFTGKYKIDCYRCYGTGYQVKPPRIVPVDKPRWVNREEKDVWLVGVLSCTKKKKPFTAPAEIMYRDSRLFALALQYFRLRKLDEIIILSAKHHVIGLHEDVKPYNETLLEMHGERRKGWAALCNYQLRCKFPNARYITSAGIYYNMALERLDVDNPMEGMGYGQKCQWLRRQIRSLKEYGPGYQGKGHG